jgi:hypothetical protein
VVVTSSSNSSEFTVVARGASAVPELSKLAMLLLSLAGLGCAGFQRSKGPSSVRLTDLRINKTKGGLLAAFLFSRGGFALAADARPSFVSALESAYDGRSTPTSTSDALAWRSVPHGRG